MSTPFMQPYGIPVALPFEPESYLITPYLDGLDMKRGYLVFDRENAIKVGRVVENKRSKYEATVVDTIGNTWRVRGAPCGAGCYCGLRADPA
jgi:hypothetical protein